MAFIILGRQKWEGSRDNESYRNYTLTTRVVSNNPSDGPANAMQTPGLPLYGSAWIPGNQNGPSIDIDVYAYCKWTTEIRQVLGETDGPNVQFDIVQHFSTKPDKDLCVTFQIEDPLLKPPELSGSFVKYTEEASFDRFGNPIQNSAFEQIRGPQAEFDRHRATVKIEMNVPSLNLPLLSSLSNCLNNAPLWGCPARCIKLNPPSWTKKYYGVCFAYYTWNLEFEINFDITDAGIVVSGFDRNVLDEGTKVLSGKWTTDPSTGQPQWSLSTYGTHNTPVNPFNPRNFTKFRDKNGDLGKVILDGLGQPSGAAVGTPQAYVCILANTGGPLTNTTLWIPWTGDPNTAGQTSFQTAGTEPIAPWDPTQIYNIGIMVYGVDGQSEGLCYVALSTSHNADPNDLDVNHAWALVSNIDDNGKGTVIPQAQGIFDPFVAYVVGDSVWDQILSIAGSIHIEKYNEGNFLLLGIPIVL
jgi:hypothetical protein